MESIRDGCGDELQSGSDCVELRFCVQRKGTETIGGNNYNPFNTLILMKSSMISCGLGGGVLNIAQLMLHGINAHRGPDADLLESVNKFLLTLVGDKIFSLFSTKNGYSNY